MSPEGVEDLLVAGGLRVEWAGPAGEPVVTVTLDRPEVRNAQTPAMWRALAVVGKSLPAATRVVVLRGAGPTFSAGLDLRMFQAEAIPGEMGLAGVAALGDEQADAAIASYQGAFSWFADSDVLTIAVVQGAAVGAGFQLALACDLRICADDARFAMKEPTLGLVPDLTGTWPLLHALGYQRALELCLTGRWLGAEEAVLTALVLRSVPLEQLGDATRQLVASLLAGPPDAARATRRLLRAAVGRTPQQQRAAERQEQLVLLRALASSSSAGT